MLTHRFDDALGFATTAHRAQTRKGSTIPYISHLMAVSALTLEYGGDEDCAIAALLHDAVEDQGGRQMAETIASRFGDRVGHIVLECSDREDREDSPWIMRKKAYIAGIAQKSEDALLVTRCDKLHNASTILCDVRAQGLGVFERFTRKRRGTLWYYGALVRAFSARRPDALTARVADTVAQLEATVRMLDGGVAGARPQG